jgi:hypothetical protein
VETEHSWPLRGLFTKPKGGTEGNGEGFQLLTISVSPEFFRHAFLRAKWEVTEIRLSRHFGITCRLAVTRPEPRISALNDSMSTWRLCEFKSIPGENTGPGTDLDRASLSGLLRM